MSTGETVNRKRDDGSRIDFRFSIAVDGPAGSGKSSVAQALARRLDLLYVDTGAMYRAVAWSALEDGVRITDREAMGTLAEQLDLGLIAEPHTPVGYRVVVGDRDITDLLHVPAVDQVVGVVAAQPAVRKILSARQRQIGLSGGVVMVGRDIATVVLPEARYKIFLTCSLEERARRRQRDLGEAIPFDTVLEQMRARDDMDTSRETAPLRTVEDAVIVDTTGRSLEETVEAILRRLDLG